MLKYKIYHYVGFTQELKECKESKDYTSFEEAMDRATALVGIHPLYNQVVVIEFYAFGDEVISSKMMEIIELEEE